MLRHFFAKNTYLSAGDKVLIEFSDGFFVSGRLLQTSPEQALLQMLAYCTRHETNVVPHIWWCIVPGEKPGLVRVKKRLPVI